LGVSRERVRQLLENRMLAGLPHRERKVADRKWTFAIDSLRSSLEREDSAYGEVKLLRRLRAKTGSDLGTPINKQDYWTAMLALNEQHSNLSNLRETTRSFSLKC
jgi:hypothetical protein